MSYTSRNHCYILSQFWPIVVHVMNIVYGYYLHRVCCSTVGNDFPSSFEAVAKKIHRLLFHVLSHIYESHYELIVILRLHGHLNTLFQHFMLFNTTHLLLEDKETEALDELFQKLLGSDRGPAEDQGQGDVRLSESNALDNHKDCLTDSTQTNSQIPEK